MENEIKYTSEDKQMVIESYNAFKKFSWVSLGNGDSTKQSREQFDTRTLMSVKYIEKLKEKMAETDSSTGKKWKLVGDFRNLINLIYSLAGLGALIKVIFFS